MVDALRSVLRVFPTLLMSLALAVAVWISAVTADDPTVEDLYPRQVPIEIIGQDAGLVLTSDIPTTISIRLRAPQSIWTSLRNEQTPVQAVIDLSGLGTGTHTVVVHPQVDIRPVEIVSYSPRSINITMERLVSRSMDVDLEVRGEPAVGYQADDPILSHAQVTVSGPESIVNQVARVRAVLDLDGVVDDIERTLSLQALDSGSLVISDVSLVPDRIQVTEVVSQRFGYRNVVVKTVVSGEPSTGYRLTNISVFPPAVTVFSSDPAIVSNLPGYVNTMPINLTQLRDDVDISIPLDLPDGISVVGDENEVLVRVSIAAIESSITMENMLIEVVGLPANMAADVSPETVTVILSGPVANLDQLTRANTRVFIDLTNLELGTHQVPVQVEIIPRDVTVETILPGNVQVVLSVAPRTTPAR